MFVVWDINPLQRIGRPWVTWALITACSWVMVTVWTGQVPLPGLILHRDGLFEPALIGHALLHRDIWHLAANMLAIWVFGDNVEDAMGHLRYALFLSAAAMVSAATQFLIQPTTPLMIGASGTAFALMGAYLLLHPRAQVAVWIVPGFPPLPVLFPASIVALGFFALQAIEMARFGTEAIAYWSHLGGLLFGVLAIPMLRARGVSMLQPSPCGADLLKFTSSIDLLLIRANALARDDATAAASLTGRSIWHSALILLGVLALAELVAIGLKP